MAEIKSIYVCREAGCMKVSLITFQNSMEIVASKFIDNSEMREFIFAAQELMKQIEDAEWANQLKEK